MKQHFKTSKEREREEQFAQESDGDIDEGSEDEDVDCSWVGKAATEHWFRLKCI